VKAANFLLYIKPKQRYKTQSCPGRISSFRQWLVSRSGLLPAPVQNDQLTEEEKKNAEQSEQQPMVASDMLSCGPAFACWMRGSRATFR
jgi:hypothetical protein